MKLTEYQMRLHFSDPHIFFVWPLPTDVSGARQWTFINEKLEEEYWRYYWNKYYSLCGTE